jgi:cation diffusion facilitator CzcD-associated flavoprotein CzcO
MTPEHVDVLIIGAGLSGIGAGVHLTKKCPDRSFLLLEARDTIGGTWDLFRYPGIRSDSDMYTLGYAFKPWTNAKAIADGPAILDYVRETAREHGIDKHIRFQHRIISANWLSADQRWHVIAEKGAEKERVAFTCGFLFSCAGYYKYDAGYLPEWPRMKDYKGRFVHPQHWPADLDYTNKTVVVIGSGATAVTLVPEMAKDAAHVTMLQRSPTFIVARPGRDGLANFLRKILPPMWAYGITRWKNVLLQQYFYGLARKHPAKAKERLVELAQKELGPGFDVKKHFTPRYNVWDQRVCLAPDGDFFTALKSGKANVVTDEIESFLDDGIQLKSGEKLKADIVVTATGLRMEVAGGVELSVDGKRVNAPDTLTFKGMMFSGIPNHASAFGYTNASWTLKCDLTCDYLCRLLNHMRERGFGAVVPVRDASVKETPWLDFTSGYVQRGLPMMPKQGDREPWKLNQNYTLDLFAMRFGKVDDPALRFTPLKAPAATSDHAAPSPQENVAAE